MKYQVMRGIHYLGGGGAAIGDKFTLAKSDFLLYADGAILRYNQNDEIHPEITAYFNEAEHGKFIINWDTYVFWRAIR